MDMIYLKNIISGIGTRCQEEHFDAFCLIGNFVAKQVRANMEIIGYRIDETYAGEFADMVALAEFKNNSGE